MARITKSVTFSDDDVVEIVANNYSGARLEQFLNNVLKNVSHYQKSSTIDACKNFVNKHSSKAKKIRGTVFCLTGDFNLGKKYWQTTITSKGGIVKSSITQSVDYLVIDNGKIDGTSSIKQRAARNLGIPIIHVSELKNFS